MADVAAADVEEPALVELAAEDEADDGDALSDLLSQAGTKAPNAMAAATLTTAIVGLFIRAPIVCYGKEGEIRGPRYG